MKITHTEKGDMILSNKSWFWFVLLMCLLLVNFIVGGYVMMTKPISSWEANIYIQLPFLAVLGFLLGRAFTRKSEFHFDAESKTINYFVQSLWSESKGTIYISDIREIAVQEGGSTDSGDPLERIVIVCEDQKIPMSVTYTNAIDFGKIKNEINLWLSKNAVA